MDEIFGYRKLIAYQKGKEIVKRTYKLLKKFPTEEKYALCDQLRRASVSITSNICRAEEVVCFKSVEFRGVFNLECRV